LFKPSVARYIVSIKNTEAITANHPASTAPLVDPPGNPARPYNSVPISEHYTTAFYARYIQVSLEDLSIEYHRADNADPNDQVTPTCGTVMDKFNNEQYKNYNCCQLFNSFDLDITSHIVSDFFSKKLANSYIYS
jgi:hypothetical protein